MVKLRDIKSAFKYTTQTARNSLEIIICIHAVLQKIFCRKKIVAKYTHHPIGKLTLTITTIVLSLVLYVILCGILLNFMIYRFYVHTKLKRKYGPDYVGLLKGTDAIWSMEDASRGLINGLMLVQYDKDGDEFYATMKQHMNNTLLKHTKFKCVRKEYKGYLFFLQNQIEHGDIVKKMEVVNEVEALDKNALFQLLSRYCNAPLPKNDTATCEILIGTQKVKWRADGFGKFPNQYPILYRLHHCIGDGLSLQNIILRRLVDFNEGIAFDKFLKPKDKQKNDWMELSNLEKFLQQIKYSLMNCYKQVNKILNLRAYRLAQLTPRDRNIMHGPKLSGKKHFLCMVEDKEHYLPIIKDIKRKLQGTGFSEIVLTAVSRSFSEYLQQKSTVVPNNFSAMLTVLPPNEDIRAVTSEKINLENRFSMASLQLPVDSWNTPVVTTLKKVKEQIGLLKNSIDISLNYWQIKIMFGLLPVSVVKNMVNKAHGTIGFSSVPGTGSLSIAGGHRILDFIFWIPNKSRVGVGVSMYTYENRFQLALLVDENSIESAENVQNILDNVFKNIDLLYAETKSIKAEVI